MWFFPIKMTFNDDKDFDKQTVAEIRILRFFAQKLEVLLLKDQLKWK